MPVLECSGPPRPCYQPFNLARDVLALLLAAGAIPGTVFPSAVADEAVSPITKMLGNQAPLDQGRRLRAPPDLIRCRANVRLETPELRLPRRLWMPPASCH